MLHYDELGRRIKEIEKRNSDISSRIKTFGEMVNAVEEESFLNIDETSNQNEDMIRLLFLDASIESKNKIKELINEKIESEVVSQYNSRGNRELELYTTYVNNISKTEENEELSIYIRYSFIERVKQKIILYILRYVDDDYLYDKLWRKLIK